MNPTYTCEQKRITYADGNWADVSVVRCSADALHFADILLNNVQARMRDAARLRYYKARIRGEESPLIIAWACLEADQPVHHMFPTLNTTSDDGEHFLSTNSFVTYTLRELVRRGWLRWQSGRWHADIPPGYADWETRASIILHWLAASNRIWLETGPQQNTLSHTDFPGCHPLLHVTAVGRCGYIRDIAREQMPAAAFNASFFLLEHDDYVSHHSALGDPYGLLVTNGAIIRPPLYRRAAIWRSADGAWQIDRIGMQDMRLILPDGTTLYPQNSPTQDGPCFAVNPATEQPVAVYTRHSGIPTSGRAHGTTPVSKGRFEVIVVDREVVAWRRDGGLLIPQNGFVLSFSATRNNAPLTMLGDLSDNITALRGLLHGGRLAYAFDRPALQGVEHALQTGPRLIQDGQIVASDTIFDEEEYWISRMEEGRYLFGVVPTEYPTDTSRTRAARIGVGIDQAGDLIVLAISGSSKGIAREGIDSVGATLIELAEQLQAMGAVQAINLDGGGSTQLFVEGGLYNNPGDRRGRQGVTYERMVPTIGLIR